MKIDGLMNLSGRKGGEAGSGGGTGEGAPAGGTGNDPAAGGGGNPDPLAGGGAPPANDKDEKFDKEYVQKLRAEAAKYRTEHQKTSARLKELEDAQLSDTEKKDKRLAELEAQNLKLQVESRNSSILALAAAAGATVPQALVGLVPLDAENLQAAIGALKKQFPDLFRKASPGGTADAGGGKSDDNGKPKAGMNEFLRRSAGRQ
jgi:hypothetical protein